MCYLRTFFKVCCCTMYIKMVQYFVPLMVRLCTMHFEKVHYNAPFVYLLSGTLMYHMLLDGTELRTIFGTFLWFNIVPC